uniref:Kunitz-type U19-barytoxin-Tl1a n=1 Tax=Trittame loki TaxID=1295018 RepID=VKT1_TRILK|nr:RecName: Full=Kunitz-type U19-barytoxin-Tl1a; Short=U19-BATX-Tl1a; AltName: Full=Kunitz-type serine protease inhibitor Kunitz-1; Flags: Precursor [Trittame loki]
MNFELIYVSSLLLGICLANQADVVPSDCNLPADAGMCYAYFPMFFYDASSRKCLNFIYGGCGGNANRFWSEAECMEKCGGGGGGGGSSDGSQKTAKMLNLDLGDICSLEKKVGPCKAHMPRYYFNRETGLCEEFIYGGCSGNHNNFQTKEQCESFCAPGNSPRPEEETRKRTKQSY